jgi:hypothetical protein
MLEAYKQIISKIIERDVTLKDIDDIQSDLCNRLRGAEGALAASYKFIDKKREEINDVEYLIALAEIRRNQIN